MSNLFDNPILENKKTYYILTNNNISMEYLSRYLIMPQGMIQKYFKDLLEICPGRIPVFKTLPKETILEYSTIEDPDTLYPVVFELSLNESDLSSISSTKVEGSSMVFFPKGVISVANISRILFRSDDDRKRFTKFVETQIANLNLKDYKLDIIADNNGLNDPVELRNQAEKLEAGNYVDEELYKRENKIAGALLVNRLIFNLNKSDSIIKGILGGIENTLEKLTLSAGIIANSEWINANFRKSIDGNHDVKTPEGLIFSILIEILSEFSSITGFSSDQLTESLLEKASSHLAKNDLKKLSEDLDNISGVLIGKMNYNDVYKECNFTMSRVLLFFTKYHNELEGFVDIEPQDKTNFKELQFLTGFLLGYYHGLDMLTVKFKDPDLDKFIANSFAYHLNNSLSESIKPRLDISKLRKEYENFIVELPIQEQLLAYFKSKNFDDPETIEKAISVAEELDIKECIKTVITPMGKEDDDFRISQTKKGNRKVLQIFIPGVADVEHKVTEDEFITRLNTVEISSRKENRIRQIIN